MAIKITNDELITDAELAERWGVTQKALRNYDLLPDGLPYWIISRKKYRGVKASEDWLAARVRRPNARRARNAA